MRVLSLYSPEISNFPVSNQLFGILYIHAIVISLILYTCTLVWIQTKDQINLEIEKKEIKHWMISISTILKFSAQNRFINKERGFEHTCHTVTRQTKLFVKNDTNCPLHFQMIMTF